MQETWVPFLGQEDPLEKEAATHSTILAWRIPWTEEPGRLQSMGSQRVGHHWETNTHMLVSKLFSWTLWDVLTNDQTHGRVTGASDLEPEAEQHRWQPGLVAGTEAGSGPAGLRGLWAYVNHRRLLSELCSNCRAPSWCLQSWRTAWWGKAHTLLV